MMTRFREPLLIFSGLGSVYGMGVRFTDVLLRIVAGGFLIPHGIKKIGGTDRFAAWLGGSLGMPVPELLAWLVVLVEVVFGACIVIGLWTRAAALGAIALMAGIVGFVHWEKGFFITSNGYEYSLMWLIVLLSVFFKGSGAYSVDAMIGKQF
ncbi:MAG: DoxX family protein [Alphaproteobacteria bacterium GM7ARS4]|nr:DoxX family protein [Alphaproteobacteria bacterium GM7ARS4]